MTEITAQSIDEALRKQFGELKVAGEQRKQELARINGGDTITDTMLQTAEELLNNAGFFS